MGKHGRKHSGIQFENHHPGCMWGMLHILDYHHVRKMLPYKRRGGGKRSVAQNGDDVNTPTSESQGNDSVIEDKNSVSSPVSRGSVKSRIKARFAVEMSKRKGKHQRSSTSPAQLQTEQTISVHNPEPESLEQDSPAEGVLDVDSPKHAHQNTESSSSCFTFDPPNSSPEPTNNVEKCDVCENSQDQTLLEETLDETKQILVEQKLKYFNEQTKDSLLYHSKYFLEALDIVNLGSELLVKALQTDGSSLPNQFHGQHALSPTMGFARSGSFPVAGSSGRKVSVPDESMDMVNGNSNTGQGRPEKSDTASTSSAILNSRNGIQVPMKRFKNLKQRIKHAINERKKEKHRITMDAFLHKIPYGKIKDVNRKFEAKWKGKAIDREGKDSPASSCESDLSCHAFSKRKLHRMRRTSSLTDSLHRYCELYDTTFNSGSKGNESQRLKFQTEEVSTPGCIERETFGRILSLPDLKSYYYVQSDDSPDVLSSTCGDQKMLDINSSLESRTQLDALVESRGDENLVEECQMNPDVVNQKGLSTGAAFSVLDSQVSSTIVASRHDVENEPDGILGCEAPEKSPNYVNESSFHQEMASPSKLSVVEDRQNPFCKQQEPVMDSLEQFESKTDVFKVELPNSSLDGGSFRFQVNTTDNADFNYVRDILEQSGFMKNTLQETWHTVDQPIDPSVFEEVTDEEGGYCNHLLLFDLVNEVLLEIYGRSFSYCPIPFSPLTHIRPMPVGNRVLEEVWTSITWYLSSRPGLDLSLDYLVSRDLSIGDGWMNLQFDTECAGLEIEDLIFDDLLEEFIYD